MMITLWIWYFCVFFSSILMCYSVMILIRFFFLSPNVASDNTLNSFIAVQNNENSALAPKSSLVHRHFVSVCVCVLTKEKNRFHFISKENGNMICVYSFHNVRNYSHFGFVFFCYHSLDMRQQLLPHTEIHSTTSQWIFSH